MARRKPRLTVITSPTAADELYDIWLANLKRYNFDHAESYEAFLKSGINALATDYDDGKEVEGFPELRRVTLKRSSQGQGHVVIYEIDLLAQTVYVHHLYHTRMDIQGRLESEFK
jgi:plasmid stabilization system protein ParE